MPALETDPFLPSAGKPALVRDAAREIRLGFVQKVYGIVSAQLLLTMAISAPIYSAGEDWVVENTWILLLATAALLATMCAMCCCQEALKTYPTNYLFLLFLTIAMATLVGFTAALYTWQTVLLSLGVTVLLVFALSMYALCTARDFTGAGPYLFAALSTLLIFGFVSIILSICGVPIDGLMIIYDIIAVIIFSFYIVFDTQMILGSYGGHKFQFSIDDYVFAALNLYLDIINLFLHLLSLLGERR